MEHRNRFSNARIIGNNVPVSVYTRQDVQRGHKDYVMSRGSLMDFAACPSKWISGHREADTTSTDWGDLIDCLALQPEKFETLYAVTPETYPGAKGEEKPWSWNANYCKEWEAQQKGRTCLTPKEYKGAVAAVDKLNADKKAQALINSSDRQVFIMADYTDKETGVTIPVKGLIDLYPRANSPFATSLGDLKTTADASPDKWVKSVFDYSYHVQAALYLDMVNATGEQRIDFLHLIQESSAPYEIGRRVVSSEFLETGRNEYISALRRYAQCLVENQWPGYDDNAALSLNGWTLTEPKPWMVKAA